MEPTDTPKSKPTVEPTDTPVYHVIVNTKYSSRKQKQTNGGTDRHSRIVVENKNKPTVEPTDTPAYHVIVVQHIGCHCLLLKS